MPSAFVTGGNGFIGSVVVGKLVQAGWAVRCLVRPTSDTSRIAAWPWERVEGDCAIRNPCAVAWPAARGLSTSRACRPGPTRNHP